MRRVVQHCIALVFTLHVDYILQNPAFAVFILHVANTLKHPSLSVYTLQGFQILGIFQFLFSNCISHAHCVILDLLFLHGIWLAPCRALFLLVSHNIWHAHCKILFCCFILHLLIIFSLLPFACDSYVTESFFLLSIHCIYFVP